MLERIPSLNRFHDIVLGHHKSWDGKMGYPSDFDNTVSKDRLFIELVHMADCMDAIRDRKHSTNVLKNLCRAEAVFMPRK